MANTSHLEKMARELNCPICLGLLNSAASLTCNHVFCNSCISKSMKAATTCPVCKVPFSRRGTSAEVRPAPHMDNLVNIYKSMEAAAGLNVFGTQTAPLPKVSDELPAHGDEEKSSGLQGAKGIRRSKRNKISDKKPKEQKKSDVCISNSSPKLSFPSKKRVHVTPYPVSETPLRPEKLSKFGESGNQCELNGQLDGNIWDGNKENSTVLKEKLALNEKGDPSCSPFFWLRERDDDDELSGKSSTQQTPDMPLIHCPRFSDIKDSESESPTKTTPSSKHHSAQVFDSEMFEWTQRACSPELCSTPIKKQTANEHTLDDNQEKGCEAALETIVADSYELPDSGKANSLSYYHENEKFVDSITNGSIRKRTLTKKSMCKKTINKKGKRAYARRKKESLFYEGIPEYSIESTELAVSLGVGHLESKDSRTQSPERKNNDTEQMPRKHLQRKHVKTLENQFEDGEAKNKNIGSKDAVVHFSALSCQSSKKKKTLDGQSEKGRRVNKNRVQSLRKCVRALKYDPMSRINNDIPPGPHSEAQHPNQENKVEIPFSGLSLQQIQNNMVLDSGNGSGEMMKKIITKRQIQIRQLKGCKKMGGTEFINVDKKVWGLQHRKCTRTSMDGDITRILEDAPSDPCGEAQNKNKRSKKMKKSLESSYQLVRKNKIVCPRNGSSKLDESVSTPQQKQIRRQELQSILTNQANVAIDKDGVSEEALEFRYGRNPTIEKVCTQPQTRVDDIQTEVSTSAIAATTAKVSGKFEEVNCLTTKLQQKQMSSVTKNKGKTQESVANDGVLQKFGNLPSKVRCSFCQSSEDSENSGEMMHYSNGKLVAASYIGRVVHSHKHCTEWAPNVYFDGETAINLEVELARSRRIKCSFCGIKGAALGCYEKSCRKSFHFTCAKLVPQCRWDSENFVMLCPIHSSSSLPNEVSETQKQESKRASLTSKMQVQRPTKLGPSISHIWKWPSASPYRWLLCCSSLNSAEKEIVSEFTKLSCVHVSKTWSPAITHVIASADENGACKRTLKFLMGIMEGKWILSIDWVKACIKTRGPVDEEQYEITADVHRISDGPQLGRLRAINKQPKLFDGFKFYFSGDFSASYRGYLQDLVVAAGGTVLHRKPISRMKEKLLDDPSASTTIIVYSLELHENFSSSETQATILDHRRAEAKTVADASGAKLATNTWILDSMAGCKLRNFDSC